MQRRAQMISSISETNSWGMISNQVPMKVSTQEIVTPRMGLTQITAEL